MWRPYAFTVRVNSHNLMFDLDIDNCDELWCEDCPFGSGRTRFLWPLQGVEISPFWAAMRHAWVAPIPQDVRAAAEFLIALSGHEAGLAFLLEHLPSEPYSDSWDSL